MPLHQAIQLLQTQRRRSSPLGYTRPARPRLGLACRPAPRSATRRRRFPAPALPQTRAWLIDFLTGQPSGTQPLLKSFGASAISRWPGALSSAPAWTASQVERSFSIVPHRSPRFASTSLRRGTIPLAFLSVVILEGSRSGQSVPFADNLFKTLAGTTAERFPRWFVGLLGLLTEHAARQQRQRCAAAEETHMQNTITGGLAIRAAQNGKECRTGLSTTQVRIM